MQIKRLLLLLLISSLILVPIGCGFPDGISNTEVFSTDANVTNIHFSTNPAATHVVFDVEVKPNLVTANTTYYVLLLSRDGYYFGALGGRGIIRWTEEELKGPDENERDYNKIQAAEERKIKRFTMGAPLTDKDIVALREDCRIEAEKLVEEYAREMWSDFVEGNLVDLFKNAGRNPELTQDEINRIFNRHLKLVVVNKEGYLKIEYPDGEIVKIDEYSGNGSFKTPNFTPQYEWLRLTILSQKGASGQGGLYYSDGRGSQYGTFNIQPNNEGKPRRLPVQPGEEYYYTFDIQDDADWHLIIEESNMRFWLEELK